MKVNFNILVKDKQGRYNVELRANQNGIRLRYNTRIKVKPDQWDKKKQMCKNSDKADIANKNLWMMRNVAMAFPTDGEITNAAFTKWMDSALYPKSDEKAVNDIDTKMEVFLNNLCNRTNQNGETISANRIANYKRIVDDFKRWEGVVEKRYKVDEMDANAVGSFLDWLRDERKLAPNTLQSRMKLIRTMLNEFKVNTDYKEVRCKGEKVEHIVLTDAEMNAMMEYDTSNNPHLDNVRRLFIVGITTGLRFSDFTNVTLAHTADGALSIHQKKTGQRVRIPIHPKLQQILDSGNMPCPISNSKFNVYLRELAMAAGVDKPVEVKTIRGGVRQLEFVPKYNLVSSHICRRSFASRLYRLGINPQIIMKLTGHKQLSTFMNYIVIEDDDVFNVVKNIW